MNIGVLSALGLSYYSHWPYFDPLFAGIISFVLIFGAWRISREILCHPHGSGTARRRPRAK